MVRSNIIDYLKFNHYFTLLFLFFFAIIASLSYHLSYSSLIRSIYTICLVGAFTLLIIYKFFDFSDLKKIIFYLIIYLIFFYLCIFFSIHIFDLTPDGRTVHLKTNYVIWGGLDLYNDICGQKLSYKRDIPFINYIWSKNITTNSSNYIVQFSSHIIYISENISLIFTGNIESIKSLKYLIFISSIYPVLKFLEEIKLRHSKFFFIFVLLFNPIIFTQFFDNYKDFYIYYFFLQAIMYFYFCIKSKKLEFKNILFLTITLCLLSTPKLNGWAFFMILNLIFSIFFIFKFRTIKFFLMIPLLSILTIFIFSFNPVWNYFKIKSFNLIGNQNIAGALLEKKIPECFNKNNTLNSFTEEHLIKYLNETSSVKLFFNSFFYKGSINDQKDFNSDRYDFAYLFKLSRDHFYWYFLNHVPFIGAAGPYFGLIFFIILIFYTYSLYFQKKSKNRIINNVDFLILVTFITILIFPYPILYRFVPQIWLLAILMLLKSFITFDSVEILKKFLVYFKKFIILNILLVICTNIFGLVFSQTLFRNSINFYFSNLISKNIHIYLSNYQMQMVQSKENFIDKNIKLIDNKNICTEKFYLYPSEIILCLENSHLNTNSKLLTKNYNNILSRLFIGPKYSFKLYSNE
jgi:hypothetical protein